MININELTMDFKDFRAVDNISLNIEEGDVFGFLGPNGAGKTTTIRMLSCIIKPTRGNAIIDGNDILNQPMEIRKKIGVLTENPCIYERLSGRYNLNFFGNLYEVPENILNQRVDELLTMFDLIDRADDKAGTYSKGMKQKLAVARTLLHNPKILFLDEPTSGLDPSASKNLRDYIKKLSEEKKMTIFLCTHNLTEAEYLCNKIAIINKGKIIGIGAPKELSRMLWSGDRSEITVINNYEEKGLTSDIIDHEITQIPGIKECIVEKDKIQISADSATEVNPIVIKKLISLDIDIIEARVLGHSLEDIYLSLIKDENGGK